MVKVKLCTKQTFCIVKLVANFVTSNNHLSLFLKIHAIANLNFAVLEVMYFVYLYIGFIMERLKLD